MTQIGLDYMKNQEQRRANLANEKLTAQRNSETRRANMANEAIQKSSLEHQKQYQWASLDQQAEIEERKARIDRERIAMQKTDNIRRNTTELYKIQKQYDASIYGSDSNAMRDSWSHMINLQQKYYGKQGRNSGLFQTVWSDILSPMVTSVLKGATKAALS